MEKKIEELERRIKVLKEEEEESGKGEEKYFGELSDEILERFVEGMLTILGELELEGMIPEIENPTQARDAMLAVIRRLYLRKSLVARMSRKFARFGAKRFLRRQRSELTKAIA